MLTASIQVLWNGGFTEEFIPSRGIMQRDPISTYLFVLNMKKLSQAIERAVSNGD